MRRSPVVKRKRSSLDFSPKGPQTPQKETVFIFKQPNHIRRFSRDNLCGSTHSISRICEESYDSESVISSERHDAEDPIEFANHQLDVALQIQEVWPKQEIKADLNALPGCQEILNLLETDRIDEVLSHSQSQHTGVLIGAWLGQQRLLGLLLEAGASPHVTDSAGRTPLHLAACKGDADSIATLLSHGGHPDVWDNQRTATPLHCAASVGSVDCLELLLNAGANIDAGLTSTGNGKSPLHYAVQSNAVRCLQVLISQGAQVNTTQVYTETPLHVAAGLGFAVCTKILIENGAELRVRCGPNKATPLHLAAEDGNAECASILLEAGADINSTTAKLQTPLHLAALAQSAKTLELLLKSKSKPNARDVDKRTPLHCAIVKGSQSCECVQLLLQHGADVNAADAFGYTPVHIAALNDFVSSLKLLLDHGGDVTKKTNGNISALSFIARRTPEILRYLEKMLDNGIKLYDYEIGDTDCEVQLDFQVLVPNPTLGETGLLLTFIEVGQRRLLRHPLCATFLCLKWRRIRKYFIISLLFHALFVILCSVYILNVFLADEKNKELSLGYLCLNILLVISNFTVLWKELFQIAHSRTGYIHHWENWLQWFIIITVFITLVPQNWVGDYAEIQHHISVFGIFFNWIELMVLMGRFPMFGIYVQMFTNGAVNFSKFLLAYCCLLLAFAFSFRLTFPEYNAFQDITVSFVKTIVMMTGELEFEDIFFPESIPKQFRKSAFKANQNVIYPVTAHIFFLFFTLVVAIVLTNLLVGLSVSDIQGLQRSAGLDRLARQVELVAYMESILFSRLLYWIPKTLQLVLKRSANLLSSPRRRKIIIKPNDPRENRIPRDLVKAIYKNIAERRPERDRRRSDKRMQEKYINISAYM